MRKFDKEADRAVTKELTQMHQLEAFALQDASTLTYEQHRWALESIMHVKHKHDDSNKARLCADGRKQRLMIRKDKSASPTVCSDLVFITAAVEVAERRRTAVVDLPGAYLSANMDDKEEVLMVLRGDLANMMACQAVQGTLRLPQIRPPVLSQTVKKTCMDGASPSTHTTCACATRTFVANK